MRGRLGDGHERRFFGAIARTSTAPSGLEKNLQFPFGSGDGSGMVGVVILLCWAFVGCGLLSGVVTALVTTHIDTVSVPRQAPSKEISEKFSACLRRLRGERSQAEFAHELGIENRAVYSRYENGRIPDRHVLERMAERLRVSPDDLLADRAEVPGRYSRTSGSSDALRTMALEQLESAVLRQAKIFDSEERALRPRVAETLRQIIEEILRRYAGGDG